MGPTQSHKTCKNEYFQVFQIDRRHAKQVLMAQRMLPHGKIRESWQKIVEQLKKTNDIYILIPNQWHVLQTTLCGNGEVIQIQYPPFDMTLTQFIEEKLSKGQHFQESELWFVLFNILEVGKRCNSLGQRIGDVRPSNILLNKSREMKVLTYLSFPNQINTFMQKQPKNYFSPEQLQGLKKQCIQNLTDPIKSQSFSIGLTILSMALLHQMSHLYKGREFNFDQLERYLQSFQSITYFSKLQGKEVKYSHSICSALRFLLKIHPQNRISYISLHKQLVIFAQNIQGFQNFSSTVQNLEAKNLKKEIITLGSRHKKPKNEGLPSSQQKKDIIYDNQSLHPIVESRYIGDESKLERNSDENDFLKQIDEKLKRSREEFPS